MNIRLVFIFGIMLFFFGALAHAQALTADDVIEKIKSVVDIDMEQEDLLKPAMENYADSINKIGDLVQKGVEKQVILEKLIKLNDALDLKLKKVLNDDQMHLWNTQKKVIYKDILIAANNPE